MTFLAEIWLPWPPPQLSPNKRLHWGEVAKAKRQYRRACAAVSRSVIANKGLIDPGSPVDVVLFFHPPRWRRDGASNGASYDEDNLFASMKSGLDGLADALGVDDRCFRISHEMGDKVRHGRVVAIVASE